MPYLISPAGLGMRNFLLLSFLSFVVVVAPIDINVRSARVISRNSFPLFTRKKKKKKKRLAGDFGENGANLHKMRRHFRIVNLLPRPIRIRNFSGKKNRHKEQQKNTTTNAQRPRGHGRALSATGQL